MPELPEVEALAAALSARTIGHRVSRVALAEPAALKTADPALSILVDAQVEDVARHGKFLDWSFVTPEAELLHLVIHLARAGWIRWVANPATAPPKPGRGPLALRVTFSSTAGLGVGGVDVTEAGTRKRLALYLVRDPAEVPGIARLGPDPLAADFGGQQLEDILQGMGGRQLKGVLRDQSILAGIGNAYSDEILHAARLSPFVAAGKLDDTQRSALCDALRSVLFTALARATASEPETLKSEKKRTMRVHGRGGQPCPVCGTTIAEVSFADSSLQYCPTCQTGGRLLADRRMSRLIK